jgi:STE24 endopeptidase
MSFPRNEEKARHYSRIKYSLTIAETGLFLVFCFFWQFSGLSVRLASGISGLTGSSHPSLTGPLYLACFCLVYYILVFPAAFYQTFLLEYQFGLSKQTLRGWFIDQLKTGLLSFVLAVLCLDAFYFLSGLFPRSWWLFVAAAWAAFQVALGILAPLVIVPLFFKYSRLADGALRTRLVSLAAAMRIRILDVYHIDFSRRTIKANAALIGMGATRRVLVSDTMQAAYTQDEIAVIVAHEFAHHRCGHVLKLTLFSSVITAGFVYLVFRSHPAVLAWAGVPSLSDPACLPVIFMYLAVWGIFSQPAMNALSRRFESAADAVAIQSTGLAAAFISSMEKLADQNLSDRDPPRAIVWLFYSHPPVNERIASARRAIKY